MRTFRSKSGPFREQPYFTDAEIETRCSDALRSVDLYPGAPGPVRIERFIELYFEVTPKYEALEDGILGMTAFSGGKVRDMFVSRKLDEENSKTSEHRIRSTFAHEAGHGLFHAYLFALAADKPLFGDHSDPQKPKVLCRESNFASKGYNGQWWEFQANKAIGALLMPKDLVELALEAFMLPAGLLGLMQFDFTKEDEAIRVLADTFNVSGSVARIRFQDLFAVQTSRQPML